MRTIDVVTCPNDGEQMESSARRMNQRSATHTCGECGYAETR